MISDESPSKIKLTDLKGLYPYIFHLWFFSPKDSSSSLVAKMASN
jgi:hypothetical protein